MEAVSAILTPIDISYRPPKPWMPERVLFTRPAFEESYGQELYERMLSLNIPVEITKGNRLPSFNEENIQRTYKAAKRTLAIVNSPEGRSQLTPIPPSADWQFHIAEGCPGHCQYCYLAGSLQGAPIIRVFANLPSILENLNRYVNADTQTSFEASCYTDPLALEHLTGGLARAIEHIGSLPGASLRWVTKYDAVEPLLKLNHNGHTQCRVSINVEEVSRRFEGGTAPVKLRLQALKKLKQAGYRVGLVVAPIMPVENWENAYKQLFHHVAEVIGTDKVTFELISHRFTANSKSTLLEWYPHTSLDLDEANRAVKRNKFGGVKYVYTKEVAYALRDTLSRQIRSLFGDESILYWT